MEIRPVILFEFSDYEVVDISLFSERVNMSRDYKIIYIWEMDEVGNGNCKKIWDLNKDDEDYHLLNRLEHTGEILGDVYIYNLWIMQKLRISFRNIQ